MGVYLCLGQSIHHVSHNTAKQFNEFGSFENIKKKIETEPVLIFLGKANHKIKKKAEQLACKNVLAVLQQTR